MKNQSDSTPYPYSTHSRVRIRAHDEIRTCSISGVLYFSIIDIVSRIVDTNRPRQWWHDYKTQDLGHIIKSTGKHTCKNRLVHEFVRVKMKSHDGKCRYTDMAPAPTILTVINLIGNKSIPMTYRINSPSPPQYKNPRHKKIRTSQVAVCRSFILKTLRGN